jgi:CPA1 family monovalent cation:H+ antiporter
LKGRQCRIGASPEEEPVYLANFSAELAAIGLTVCVLFLASLISLAPLRKLRLPFTVAVMLAGFAGGVLVNNWFHPHDHGLVHDLLGFFNAGGNLTPNLILFVLLPPLVFESAYNLDARLFFKNLPPIAILAVPALISSTVITGSAVMLFGGAAHGLTWPAAFLFGALISATDPVAVVALFKDLGAPKRLGILVEGESLMNDGTAIVLFNLLLAIVIAAATGTGGGLTIGEHVLGGVTSFFVVALGGVGVGLILALPLFALIGRVVSNEAVEISISVVLAYASFIVAEHFLHVSGVMATVTAGLVAGSYGQTKVSPSVVEFMHSFWEYMAFAMNSMIFFVVGLVIARQVSWADFVSLLPLFGATLVVVIAARALGVFGSMPFVQRYVERISTGYQTVMWWGGLRGAVSLALALTVFTHPELPQSMRTTVLVLSAAIVLFTLLVNALSMLPLIKSLGLDRPSPQDRFTKAFAEHERTEVAHEVVQRLEKEGAVLHSVLTDMQRELEGRHERSQAELNEVASEIAADATASREVAARVAISVEKREVMRRFSEGEFTEAATRALLHDADGLLDRVKAGSPLPEDRVVGRTGKWEAAILAKLEPLPILGGFARRTQASRLAISLEATRGLYVITGHVEKTLAEIEAQGAIPAHALSVVQLTYAKWRFQAQEQLSRLNSEFPEYSYSSQRHLTCLQLLRAERKSLHHLAETGLLTEKSRAEVNRELIERESVLLEESPEGLELDAETLLRRVSAFQGMDAEVMATLAKRLVSRTLQEGSVVVEEGDEGDSLFLVARGCVGVFTQGEGGVEVRLSTMDAGESFGEIAALLGGTRRATVRAVTPVALLELRRSDLAEVLFSNPKLDRQVRDSVYPRAVGRALVDCAELAALSEAQRAGLACAFVVEEHSDGACLVEEGQPQRLTYVCSGKVQLGQVGVCEGAVFGVGALADETHESNVTIEGKGRVLVLPPESLKAFCAENPSTVDAVRKALKA